MGQEGYKEIMEACYVTTLIPSAASATIETYNIWRLKNTTTLTYLDANKLSNVKWDIMRSNLLTDIELDTIKARVMQNNPQPVRDMEVCYAVIEAHINRVKSTH